MSMFDAEISVLNASVGTPTQEAMDAGTPPHVEFGVISGFALPVANPATGQPLIVPAGKLRFVFSREQAIEIFEGALEAAKALPETPVASGKLLVANSMSEVEQAAQNIKRVTGQ